MNVSVVIPARNEAESIAASIESARAAGALEVIVSDGGSSDGTCEIAEAQGAKVVHSAHLRGAQLNQGAAAASGEILLFLHADTTLPAGAIDAVRAAVAGGAEFGAFSLRFAERPLRLRVAERMINLRSSWTRSPWGDQAQFVTRRCFDAAGGYREIPIMEDYEFARRMKQTVRSVVLPLAVTTSGRRFLRHGLVRTAWTNWRLVLAFENGADPSRLAEIYRR